MSLNESIVEDAALECFGELGYAVGHGPHFAPGELASRDGGRDSFSEVLLVARLRDAIRRPAVAGPSIPEKARATIRNFRIVQFPVRRRTNS